MSAEDLQLFFDRYTKCKIQDNIKVSQERKHCILLFAFDLNLKNSWIYLCSGLIP